MSLGINVKTCEVDIELEEMLDNLRFMCTTPYGFSEEKYEYYKEKILGQYSSEDSNKNMIVENEKEIINIQFEIPSDPLSIGPMDSAWPIAYHDALHTSRSPYSTADNLYDEKWRFYTDGRVNDNPVIDSDGTIYIGQGWDIYAVYPDGYERWMFKTGGLIRGSSSAIAEDGTIYVGSWDGGLYAINPGGTQKWRFGSGAQIASSPVIADDGSIYFGIMGPGDYGRIFAVNSDGTEKWHYDTDYWIVSDPCIGDDGTVYIGSGDTYLYAMNPDGTLKWRFKTGDIIQGHPSIANDGTIYIGSFDDYLYALNPDGAEKWKCGVGPGTETNPSIASDGTVYVGSDKLYAIYPDGTVRWSFNPGADRFIISSPAISADGTIYFGTNIGEVDGGEIIAVNPDGTERWRKRIANAWVDSSPSIAEDGTVYIGCAYSIDRGYLHAFGNVESNNPPNTPTITGPTKLKLFTEYRFIYNGYDPDNNPIELFVDWGDGNSGWIDWYASGEEEWIYHTWTSLGTFTVKVKVRDEFGGESDWGYLEVSTPRNRATNTYFFKLLERFPLLERLLSLLRV